MKMLRVAVLSMLLTSSALAVSAQDTLTPKAFVQKVFDDYKNPDWQHHWQRQIRFFSRELDRQITADERSNRGYAPKMDFDPICDCQDPGDPGDLKIQSITLTPEGPQRMKATAIFTIVKDKRVVTLHLLKTSSGWRIDDISTKEVPSLRKYFSK